MTETIIMRFSKEEIQKEIDRIQTEENSPEFMKVNNIYSYYLDKDSYFWNEEEETSFFAPKSKKPKELLTELARAIIEQSL